MGLFGDSGMGTQAQQPTTGDPVKTENASMLQIVDEYRNRYNVHVMETGQDPISGTDKPVDIQTFIQWRQKNPPNW